MLRCCTLVISIIPKFKNDTPLIVILTANLSVIPKFAKNKCRFHCTYKKRYEKWSFFLTDQKSQPKFIMSRSLSLKRIGPSLKPIFYRFPISNFLGLIPLMTHTRKKNTTETGKRPLLSHTSILIISIFVLGMATGKVSSMPANSTYLMMGVFGLISYFGLGSLATRIERKKQKQLLEKKEVELEGRLERHLVSRGPKLSLSQHLASQSPDPSSQYQTVNKRPFAPHDRF